jgi:hypothetical protein
MTCQHTWATWSLSVMITNCCGATKTYLVLVEAVALHFHRPARNESLHLGIVQRHNRVLDLRHVFAELLAQHFEVRHKLVDDPCAVVLLHAAGANVQLRFDVLLQLLRLRELRKPKPFRF